MKLISWIDYSSVIHLDCEMKGELPVGVPLSRFEKASFKTPVFPVHLSVETAVISDDFLQFRLTSSEHRASNPSLCEHKTLNSTLTEQILCARSF